MLMQPVSIALVTDSRSQYLDALTWVGVGVHQLDAAQTQDRATPLLPWWRLADEVNEELNDTSSAVVCLAASHGHRCYSTSTRRRTLNIIRHTPEFWTRVSRNTLWQTGARHRMWTSQALHHSSKSWTNGPSTPQLLHSIFPAATHPQSNIY